MELLAPAGGRDALTAAIENGADAVYIGGNNFSARQGAENFDLDEIRRTVEYTRFKGRKVYVAVNTIIANDEFQEALDYVYQLYCLAVDAVIIQDLGLLCALRTLMPALPVHASTQMTVHNGYGVSRLKDMGIKRVVLARELSGEEIGQIKAQVPDMELEMFAHGALCYSYSGQCLFSSMVGGRSGNRGRCAQPCRLSYDLCTPASPPLRQGDKGRYLLSPADLCLIDYLADIRDRGVTSLKIEGRMKRPEYVAVVTRAYREAIDALRQNRMPADMEKMKKEMLQVFNRNFSSGYYFNQPEGFLSSKRPNNRGVYIGRVLKREPDGLVEIKLSDNLHRDDGIQIWVARGKNPTAYVGEITIENRSVAQAAAGDIVKIKIEGQVAPGDRVFKIYDKALMDTYVVKDNRSKIALDAEVVMNPGQSARILFRDENGNRAEVFTVSPVQPARRQGLDETILRDKLGRLGNTPFTMEHLTLISSEEAMVPVSELNEARRQAVEQLRQAYLAPYHYPPLDEEKLHKFRPGFMGKAEKPRATTTLLSIMVAGEDEARAAINAGVDRVYLGLEGLGKAKPVSLKALRTLTRQATDNGCQLVPALPRIQKPGEEKEWEGLLALGCDNIMVGNLGSLKWAQERGFSLMIDYPLNVFNNTALEHLLNVGAKSVCMSPELSFKQLQAIMPRDRIELLVQGELILMLSQFCTLRAVLGNAGEKCPAFCRQKDYYIKDDKGYQFPLAGDSKCRFYLFNSRTLCMLDDLQQFMALGIGSVRIEARRQDPEAVAAIAGVYRQVLDELRRGGRPDTDKLKARLRSLSPSDFTKCHYYRGVM